MFRYEMHIVGSFQRKQPFFPLPLRDYDEVWDMSEPRFRLEEANVDFEILEWQKDRGLVRIRLQNGLEFEMTVGDSRPLHLDYAGDEELECTLSFSAMEAGEDQYEQGFVLTIREYFNLVQGEQNRVLEKHYHLPLSMGESVYLEALEQYVTIVGLFPQSLKAVVKICPRPGKGKNYDVFEHKEGGYRYVDSQGAYENFYYEERAVTLNIVHG